MRIRFLALGALTMTLLPGAGPVSDVTISVDALRSHKGLLQMCLTRESQFFPDCENDPNARRLTVRADGEVVHVPALASGLYALSIVHDENGNSRLDTFAGIPKEGVGFSRNPKLAFGPPRFSKVLFDPSGAGSHQTVKMRYFL